jgi:EAL domain-containing protein (putative c-di-GMP-specific phosphodiesterase class I)
VGGDEFILVSLFDGATGGEVTRVADRVIEQVSQPVPYRGHDCRLGASIGIAIETGEKVDPVSLMVNSDIALYRAKKNTRGGYEFFSEEIQREIVNTKRVADDILRGLDSNEFFAVYQPQFDARTFDIVGVEALARWNHPEQGILAPAHFLKVAEDLGAVDAIDRMILAQAVDDFNDWVAKGFEIPKVAVNVSLRRLNNSGLVDSLRGMQIKPGTLTFELVESVFLDEADEIVAFNIDQIKELGIDIEIDDFGTGYASIVSLLKLSPVRLKIDRQFVTPITSSVEKRRLVSSIVDMGKSLGIEVVAEGVETMKQAQILREIGCDVLQGYAFARPMPTEDLEEFVRNQSWRSAS